MDLIKKYDHPRAAGCARDTIHDASPDRSAHNFDNLLTVIVGNLQLLTESPLTGEAAQQAQTALRAALRSAELTRGLLAFSHRHKPDPAVVNLNERISDMQTLLRRTLQKPVSVELRCADALWPTRVDPAQLENAILNLVANSRDAMNDNGQLTIETYNMNRLDGSSGFGSGPTPGDYVVLSVMDDGTGMSDEMIAHAFEPFFGSRTVGQGAGLGLSMVYGFARQSGGYVTLESTQGEGTTATICLPRWMEPRVTPDLARNDEPCPGDETLLVVDDDPDALGKAAELLSSLGYRVVQAASGREALRALARDHIDLLFSELVMTQMSGTVLARKVAAMYPELPILLTSGYADVFVTEQEGTQKYELMQKPYDKCGLAKRIRTILAKECAHERDESQSTADSG